MIESQLLRVACKIALIQIGLDLKSVGSHMIETAINKRMRRCGLGSSEYILRLESSINEQHALCQLLLVSESWFEREREPLELALKNIKSAKVPLKVLSVPCARGEEPISILSVAIDSGVPVSNIMIDSYDASVTAIEQAKLFSYGEYSFRGASERFRSEYFKKHGPRFILNYNLQQVFQFDQANILDVNWFPRQTKYDLIVCRNMLIYLEQAMQKRLLEKLQSLLEDSGLLVLGAAEAALAGLAELDCSDFSTLVFRKRIKKSVSAAIKLELKNKSSYGLKTNICRYQRSIKSVIDPNKDYVKSKLISGSTITQKSFDLANQGRLEEAFEMALKTAEKDPADSSNYYLLGLISSSAGKIEEARYWISKALELNPQDEDAEIFFNSLSTSKLCK